jgi:probable phosphoglycerate mutase
MRHGQTDWNLEKRFQGGRDIPLNAEGIKQAHRAKNRLKDLKITHIYSSPLQRARVTADIANSVLDVGISNVRDLQECNFGVLEGTLRQAKDSHSDNWRNGITPQDAEIYIDFTARVFAAINHILENEGTPLIVAHGAVFWPVHSHMQLGLDKQLPNATPIYLAPPPKGAERWSLTEL